jgi:putative Mg2+ transporter-C (MgtC) family protein
MNLVDILMSYWSYEHSRTNFIIILNLIGALALGLILGYERTYHGRAAGMRTYGLVCMVSAGVVSISGYTEYWYGSQLVNAHFYSDPTRTIQGILTGIGFLCAGVIMKERFTISGLTTAASIWTVSAVGILVGVGLYGAAITLAFGTILCMTFISKVEVRLPAQPAVAVRLKFNANFVPDLQNIKELVRKSGYNLAQGSISISHQHECTEWQFVVLAIKRKLGANLPDLAQALHGLNGVEDLYLSYARN